MSWNEVEASFPGDTRHRQWKPAGFLSHRGSDRRRGRVLSDYPLHRRGRTLPAGFRRREIECLGGNTIAIEAEGEHAAQGGAIAHSVCGKRVVNYTSGQGVVYGVEQYYHAPGKCSTMVLEVGARALTKHALNVHCG